MSDILTTDTHDIDAAAERIRLSLRRSAHDIVSIGRDLLLVKEQLKHGDFEEWIKAEFAMTIRTAERFMSVAQRFDENDIVSDLAVSVLYELAAPSTPEPVVQAVKKRVANGETLTIADIKRLRAESQLLRGENAVLRDENATLADSVAELEGKVVHLPVAVIDRRAEDRQYDALVALWRAMSMELRARFFEEHKTPYAARSAAEETTNAH